MKLKKSFVSRLCVLESLMDKIADSYIRKGRKFIFYFHQKGSKEPLKTRSEKRPTSWE